MTDYIKREDALQDIDNAHANTITQRGYKDYWSADLETQLVCDGLAKAIEAIFDTPSADVVEVVRCKDCKHRNKEWYQDKRHKDGGYWLVCCENDAIAERIYGLAQDDDFCSYGERADA